MTRNGAAGDTCRVTSSRRSPAWARPPRSGRVGWDPFIAPGGVEGWLEWHNWRDTPAFAGNEVMNVGTLLQYARDFQGHPQAGDAMRRLLAWLAGHHVDAAAGVWGYKDLAEPLNLSDEVQAAYHFWPLFFYDHVPVPHPERAIDTVLRTQNPRGGFGWGVHNRPDPWNSQRVRGH